MRRRQTHLPQLETPDAKRLFVERNMPELLLSYWDTITLRYLLQWLDTSSVSSLLQTGDILLATKLHTQITSLHYTKLNLERAPDPPRWVPVSVAWAWPSLLTASSLHQLTTLRIDNTRHALQCDLSVIPPTLTKLALVSVSLVLQSEACLHFQLPNLQHLRLDRIVIHMVYNAIQVPITRLKTALSQSPHIHTFRYTPSTMPSSLCDMDVRDFLEMLPMLEKLSVPYLNYQITHWPHGLHTLCLHRYHSGIFSTRGSLVVPPSIKTLIIQDSIPLQVMRRILESTPTSLTCLEANLLYRRDGTAINEIARFTQLQSLHLPRCAELEQMKVPLTYDLPPSITALSESFAIHPPSWAFISGQQIKLLNRKPLDSSKQAHAKTICIYDRSDHEDYALYFPVGFTSVHLIDSNVPVPNTNLHSVGMMINRLSVFSRRECATIFTNMPRTLTSLKIEVLSSSLIWLDGFDEMSEPASSRFPCLKAFSLQVTSYLSSDQNVCAWLNHLPQSLERLSLCVRGKQYTNQNRLFNKASVAFPPNLTSLKLKLGRYLIDMPDVLPPGLIKTHLEFHGIINPESFKHIASWPTTLCKIHLHGFDETTSDKYLTPALATFNQRANWEPTLYRGSVEESGHVVSYIIVHRKDVTKDYDTTSM